MNYARIVAEAMNGIASLEEKIAFLEDKVTSLEKEIEVLKETANVSLGNVAVGEIQEKKEPTNNESDKQTGRDSTKYILDDKKYGKNRLVLAVVKKYVNSNPEISAEELMTVFDKSLQGSLGVVRTLQEVQDRYDDYNIRYFTAEDEIIHTSTQDCAVCTQWGIANINRFLERAEELGIKIDIRKSK